MPIERVGGARASRSNHGRNAAAIRAIAPMAPRGNPPEAAAVDPASTSAGAGRRPSGQPFDPMTFAQSPPFGVLNSTLGCSVAIGSSAGRDSAKPQPTLGTRWVGAHTTDMTIVGAESAGMGSRQQRWAQQRLPVLSPRSQRAPSPPHDPVAATSSLSAATKPSSETVDVQSRGQGDVPAYLLRPPLGDSRAASRKLRRPASARGALAASSVCCLVSCTRSSSLVTATVMGVSPETVSVPSAATSTP